MNSLENFEHPMQINFEKYGEEIMNNNKVKNFTTELLELCKKHKVNINNSEIDFIEENDICLTEHFKIDTYNIYVTGAWKVREEYSPIEIYKECSEKITKEIME